MINRISVMTTMLTAVQKTFEVFNLGKLEEDFSLIMTNYQAAYLCARIFVPTTVEI